MAACDAGHPVEQQERLMADRTEVVLVDDQSGVLPPVPGAMLIRVCAELRPVASFFS